MERFIILLIFIGSIIYTIIPFFKKDVEKIEIRDEELERLKEEKESIYSIIKDIEFDYKTNKLSYEDYNSLINEYKKKAIIIMKEIDKKGG
jgi:hypothetical protein